MDGRTDGRVDGRGLTEPSSFGGFSVNGNMSGPSLMGHAADSTLEPGLSPPFLGILPFLPVSRGHSSCTSRVVRPTTLGAVLHKMPRGHGVATPQAPFSALRVTVACGHFQDGLMW